MELQYDRYFEKLKGCFTGKCVGGTLGMKYEGNLNVHEITYYDPVPTEVLPNDDLDIQVIMLELFVKKGLPVSRFHLGDVWKYYYDDQMPDEYGAAKSNNEKGIFAPLSGRYNNKFFAGMGSAIRSELWACLAPGDPALAARLAVEDACTDHYDDGIDAERFLAALESAVFVTDDLNEAIETAYGFLEPEGKLARAFADVRTWYAADPDVLRVREKVLAKYPADNWTDVTINLSFILLALLVSGGDFSRGICTAVSLGYDTDCTGATTGSILGILNPAGIEERWTKPIGEALVLSANIPNMCESRTVGEFCDVVAAMSTEILTYYGSEVTVQPTVFAPYIAKPWCKNIRQMPAHAETKTESLIAVAPLVVHLEYPEHVALCSDRENKFALCIGNPTEQKRCGSVSIGLPQVIIAAPNAFTFELEPGQEMRFPFTLEKAYFKRRIQSNRLTFRFETDGFIWQCEAGVPDARCAKREDLSTGETETVEIPAAFFPVPAGKYRYTFRVKSGIEQTVRMTVNGTAAEKVYMNGEYIAERDFTQPYVPAFHRGQCALVTLKNGWNTLELVFENDKETEAFVEFATDHGCAEWLTNLEYC